MNSLMDGILVQGNVGDIAKQYLFFAAGINEKADDPLWIVDAPVIK
jgi:hypothetical protein